MKAIKERLIRWLRWSERYTKTDMVYFASGNFWLIASRIVSIGSGLVLTFAFARLIPPETFGTYKYVIALAGFISAFSLGGLGGAVGRSVAQGNQNVVPRAFRTGIYWSLPASAAAFIGGIYYFLNGNIPLGFGLLLITITNPFLNNFGIYKSILLGKKDFKKLAFYNTRGILPVLAMITTLFLSENVLVILLVYFASNFLIGAIVYLTTLKTYGIKDEPGGVQETITYGKHLSVLGAVMKLTDNLDQLMLWHFSGPVQLATYSFALAPIREIRNFSENVHPLIFPKFITKTVEEMKRTVPLRVAQLLVVSCAIGILYIWLAPLLYKYIFPQYVNAIFASQILALGLLFQPKILVESMLYAQGNVKIRYVTVFLTQGAKVVFWFTLIPSYGFFGAAVGTLLADTISAVTLWWAYKKLK